MLALILAAALDPHVGALLTACDTPKLTKACGLYLRGFVDSMLAAEGVSQTARRAMWTQEVLIPTIACFPSEPDLDRVRVAVVRELKRGDEREPARDKVLHGIAKLYPCTKEK